MDIFIIEIIIYNNKKITICAYGYSLKKKITNGIKILFIELNIKIFFVCLNQIFSKQNFFTSQNVIIIIDPNKIIIKILIIIEIITI